MRIVMFVLFSLVILVLIFRFNWIQLYSDQKKLAKEATELREQIDSIKKENESLKSKLEYLSHPENLEKELRAQFNYTSPGEKLIILTPGQATTTSPQ